MLELPQALNSSLLANINRDSKRQRKPYRLDEFCFFQSKEERNIPSRVFGAAAMELIKRNLFPSWALFTYKDLRESAEGDPPADLCYKAKDALIIAPEIDNRFIYGMLIAQESASGKFRAMEDLNGKRIFVYIPEFRGKFYTEENIGCPIQFYIDEE